MLPRETPLLLGIALLLAGPARGEEPAAAPTSQPASQPASQQVPPADPFSRLRVVTPRDKLPPLRSVRVRDKREQEDRSRKGTITVIIRSIPKGASVTYGGKLLGRTPVTLKAPRGSTPLDVVVKARGFMTLRTRIRRKVTRSYTFKLTPAKLR
jgi:hypothetical protein